MNQNVIKALKILDYFTGNQSQLTLSEISKLSGLPKTSTHRLLQSLTKCGYLMKIKNSEQDVKYQLGLKLLELGFLVKERLEIRSIALPIMKKLNEHLNETVLLLVVDNNEAVYIEKVQGQQHIIRIHAQIGVKTELYIGAGPKLLLAFLDEKEKEDIIKTFTFEKITETTIDNKDLLIKELENIKTNGYSISHGERDVDTFGIAYPIFEYSGNVVAALTVTWPQTRIKDKKQIEFSKERIHSASKEISTLLGYRGD